MKVLGQYMEEKEKKSAERLLKEAMRPKKEEKEVEEESPVENFEKKDDDEDKDDDSDSKEDQEEDSDDTDDTDDDEEKNKYSLLEQQYNDLSTQYEQLKKDYDALVEFKNNIENEKKDALINEFYMLSDEDKKDIIENKSKYSLEEIKAKLAVICYEKKVNFNSESSEEIDNNKEEKVTTFTFNDSQTSLPDWVKVVKNNMENN